MVQTLRIICVVAALATLAILVKVSDLSQADLIAIFMVFAILVNVPYILGWIFAGKMNHHRAGLIILAIGIVAATAFGLTAYYDTFFSTREKDAQDALVLVVLPVYQTGAIVVAFLIAKAVARFRG